MTLDQWLLTNGYFFVLYRSRCGANLSAIFGGGLCSFAWGIRSICSPCYVWQTTTLRAKSYLGTSKFFWRIYDFCCRRFDGIRNECEFSYRSSRSDRFRCGSVAILNLLYFEYTPFAIAHVCCWLPQLGYSYVPEYHPALIANWGLGQFEEGERVKGKG